MAAVFLTLCEELSRLQVQMLRREGSPSVLGNDAVRLLHRHAGNLEASRESAPYLPTLLRTCATLFQKAMPSIEAYEVLNTTTTLASYYIDHHYGDVNDSCTVLRSVMQLEKVETMLHKGPSNCSAPPLFSSSHNYFGALVEPAYNVAWRKLWSHHGEARTVSLLALLLAVSRVHAAQFEFSSPPDMRGLLPIKSKLQMEAKIQRCQGAREILRWMQGMKFSRLDASMCLQVMAETGLYDSFLCDKSCEVLYGSRVLVSSTQNTEILYNLGVVQHRHIHLTHFSNGINAMECNSEAIRRQVVGLAMLQVPPSPELMDGVFLHALRDRRREPKCPPAYRKERSGDSAAYSLTPQWYIDIAHGLACLHRPHQKFCLRTARCARRGIGHMSIESRCKLLYGIGGIPLSEVTPELRTSWESKVERAVAITAETLKEMPDPSDGPRVMKALQHCGIRKHPRIPPQPEIMSGSENPIDILRRAWSSTSKEGILSLSERVEPEELQRVPTATLANVLTRLANSAADTTTVPPDAYRYGPLFAAVVAYEDRISVDDALRVIHSMQRMGLASVYREPMEKLLELLWLRRFDMSELQLRQCYTVLRPLRQHDTADSIIRFCAGGH